MSVKSYKKIIFMYILSLFAVMGISIVINLKEDKNVRSSILIMLITLIPAIYSLIPLIKDLMLVVNRSKKRLTSERFTDRESDLEHLLKILSSQDHRIEIKGKEESCGKTWLAMRLCDYINNPRDKSLGLFKIKFPYKRSFYFDMQKCNTGELDDFFNSNIITSKDVLIFDHVDNIERFISRQEQYHFQMVYVMKRPVEIDFSSHHISKFNIENMEKLHNKIRSTYPNRKRLIFSRC